MTKGARLFAILLMLACGLLGAPGLYAETAPAEQEYTPFADNSLIPLTISLGFGYLPEDEHRDFSFDQGWKMELDLIYRLRNDLGLGAGLEFYSRSVPESEDQDYQVRMLNASITWIPHYNSRRINFVMGCKAGINIISYEGLGDLGSPEPNTCSLGLEPSIGVLFPVRRHQFIKLGLTYSWMEIPELYHQDPAIRREHIRHDNLILSLSYVF